MTKETKDAPPAEPVPGRGAVEEVEAIDVTRYGALMKMRDKALSLAARLEEAERDVTWHKDWRKRAEQAERRLEGWQELEEICKFLLGEAAYKGFWYGEVPLNQPQFWWRKHMRAAMLASAPEHEPNPPAPTDGTGRGG